MIEENENARPGEGLCWQQVLDSLPFNAEGLLPAIAQQHDTNEVLMMAWVDREALAETVRTGRVCYYSRSRGKLWRKGESSGQAQHLRELRLDCDGDAILLRVDQRGPACHTGRRSCFYNVLQGDRVVVNEAPLVDPDELYR